tara:strand:- start:117 stop:257 length:141 start_codon:yes stop_codon:yes gene_type:complete
MKTKKDSEYDKKYPKYSAIDKNYCYYYDDNSYKIISILVETKRCRK